MTGQRWVRSSLRSLSRRLAEVGHAVSPPTVGRLLGDLDFARHVNAKQVEAHAQSPERDQQFTYIADQRTAFAEAGWPVVSVDSKKKELVGNFKNAGATWGRAPERVNVHDFPQDGVGRAVPYGVYDVQRQQGFVCVGTSRDTPAFAVDAVANWWQAEGEGHYPSADRLLVLADGGGSNGCHSRVWKQRLQGQVCDRFGLSVTVCHYPRGCSKWNPIEHRLFSQISRTWAGVPLRSWQAVLGLIGATTTTSGLVVRSVLNTQTYPTGERVSDAAMAALNLEPHAVCPTWNYTLHPRPSAPDQELIL
jgi:Rhodopirellula transposase DDE domain